MSEYKMDIKGIIGLSDYSSINDYIGLVDYDEKFTITDFMRFNYGEKYRLYL